MNIEDLRDYCLKKEFVTESFPFDEVTLVFKVMNKMFCLAGINPPLSMNLKCDPEYAIELRERYDDIVPGYHMNKTHWNTVSLNGDVKNSLLYELIDHSYDLVVLSLPKKVREKFAGNSK